MCQSCFIPRNPAHVETSPFQNFTLSKLHPLRTSPFYNFTFSKLHHFNPPPSVGQTFCEVRIFSSILQKTIPPTPVVRTQDPLLCIQYIQYRFYGLFWFWANRWVSDEFPRGYGYSSFFFPVRFYFCYYLKSCRWEERVDRPIPRETLVGSPSSFTRRRATGTWSATIPPSSSSATPSYSPGETVMVDMFVFLRATLSISGGWFHTSGTSTALAKVFQSCTR